MYYHQLSPYLNKDAERVLMKSEIRVNKVYPIYQTPDHIIKSCSSYTNEYPRRATPLQNNSPSWRRSLCNCFASHTTMLTILCRTYKDKEKKRIISNVEKTNTMLIIVLTIILPLMRVICSFASLTLFLITSVNC